MTSQTLVTPASRLTRDKVGSLLLVLLLHGGLIAALILGLGLTLDNVAKVMQPTLTTFDVPPPVERASAPKAPDERAAAEEGAASAENVKNRATPVVAPKLDKPPPTKNKSRASDKPRDGRDAANGAGDTPSNASGAGGAGDGTGSGASGTGTGGGGSGDGNGAGFKPTGLKKIAGQIKEKDYRKKTGFSETPGAVQVWYTVRADGRVSGCRVMRPSGNAARDRLTCQLIEERWRYQPARGRDGQPVAVETGWEQKWWPND